MDLSKAFDCIRHDFLIAKLHAYGFSREALWFVYSYLENRQQRVKINGSFSTYKHLRFGVPRGSALGPLFFKIYGVIRHKSKLSYIRIGFSTSLTELKAWLIRIALFVNRLILMASLPTRYPRQPASRNLILRSLEVSHLYLLHKRLVDAPERPVAHLDMELVLGVSSPLHNLHQLR